MSTVGTLGSSRYRGASRFARLAGVTACAALALSACASAPEPDAESEPAPTLHVAVAPSALDQAVGHAVAEYLRDQGATVTVNTVAQPWRSQSATDIAVVNSLAMAATLDHEDADDPDDDSDDAGSAGADSDSGSDDSDADDAADEQSLSIDTEIESYLEHSSHAVLAETPGTLRLNLVTSAATSAYFGVESLNDLDPQRRGTSGQGVLDGLTDTGEPDRSEVTAAEVCSELDWDLAAVPAPLRATVIEDLDEIGCTISAEAVAAASAGATESSGSTADPSAATVEHLLSTPDAAGMLYGPDPRIVDHGFTTLQDSDRLLPEGRFLVLGDAEALEEATGAIEQPVSEAVSTVASRLDGEQLTELTRIHQRAQPSALDLDSATAARYWLFDQQLIDTPDGWF